MKTCKNCKLEKSLDDFKVQVKDNKKYYRAVCIKCSNFLANHKKQLNIKSNLTTYISKSLDNAKTRAKNKGFEFSLTKEWYIANLPSHCPVFNTVLDFTSTLDEHKPSIDRVNSAKGYTEENCKIISWKANNIKNQWNLHELQAVVNYLKQNDYC